MQRLCNVLLVVLAISGYVSAVRPMYEDGASSSTEASDSEEGAMEAGSDDVDDDPQACQNKAGQAVWDKYCEWKDTGAAAPNAKLWTGGSLATNYKTEGGIHETTVATVDALTAYCNTNPTVSATDESAKSGLINWWFKHGDMMCKEDVQMYFGKVPSMDRDINDQFGPLHDQAMANQLDHWACQGGDYLVALVLLYDQLTRNLGRCGRGQDPIPDMCGSIPNVQMYSGDAKAQAVALFALGNGMYTSVSALKKQFIHLVLTHSENVGLQALCLELTMHSLSIADIADIVPSMCTNDGEVGTAEEYAGRFAGVWLGIAAKHYFVVDYFGRQPHRNRYVPETYYTSARTDRGWLTLSADGPRTSNTGKWNTFGDPEAVTQPSGATEPEGWTLEVSSCAAMTGEEAFKNAKPMQFNDAGLPPPGDGDFYNGNCAVKATGGALVETEKTEKSEGKLHWLD